MSATLMPGMSAPAPTEISPTYLSDLFPGGLPQISTRQASAPYAQAYQSSATTANTPNASAYLANPSTVGTDGLGANSFVQQILSVLAPQYQQQDQALTQNLANAGIVGGSTGGALTDLAAQQNAQTAAAIAPYEQTAQQTLLGANEFNAGAQNTASLANQGALNQNAQYNAGNALNASEFNASTLNTNAQNNANALNQNSEYNATNGLNASEFNTGAMNNAATQNVANLLNSGQYDAGTANTILGQTMGYQNQDYLQQLNNQLQLQIAAQGGQTNAFQPNYQQPSPPNFSGLAGAFGANAAANPYTSAFNNSAGKADMANASFGGY